MSTTQLEEGYQRAYRDFYTWRNLFAGASAHEDLTGKLRHFAYAAGRKKCEPLWHLLIRRRQVARGLPFLEAVLDGLGKVGSTCREHPPERVEGSADVTLRAETYTP